MVFHTEIWTLPGLSTVEFLLCREEVLPPILVSPQLLHLEEQIL